MTHDDSRRQEEARDWLSPILMDDTIRSYANGSLL